MSFSVLSPNGFAPILAIFYSVFHPTEGSKVLCQVPRGAVVPHAGNLEALEQPLFPFYSIKNYVIPKPPLCNRLVSIKINQYRVVGYPVLIQGETYKRNSFIFNFAFVFHARAEATVYETSIRRLAKMFMALEEQCQYLSKATTSLDTISNIIQQIYQDLNNFSECMIPVDESNSADMKLFPLISPPPEVESFHVPISTVRLDALRDEYWDPTMEKIVPYINGLNSVRRIADLADADYSLTKQCIQHLIHYQCIVIVDIFQFSNIYAPTAEIGQLLSDASMFAEFQAYVYKPRSSLSAAAATAAAVTATGSSNSAGGGGPAASGSAAKARNSIQYKIPNASTPESRTSILSNSYGSNEPGSSAGAGGTGGHEFPLVVHVCPQVTCFNLYRSLHQGITVHDWYLEHRKSLENIDVRRFISFGVIKGIIYRIHSYPVYEPASRFHRRHSRASHHEQKRPNIATDAEVDKMITDIIKHPRHFDSICTDLRLPKWQVEKALQVSGDWTVISC